MLKKSLSVTVGIVLAGVVSLACADSGEEYADAEYSQACMNEATLLRADDSECGDDDGNGGHVGHSWYYYKGHSVPAVGQKLNKSYGTSVRPPAGSFARPPATGGFGRTVISGGS